MNMEEGAPWLGSPQQRLKTRGLNERPNAPFFLMHHPEQWDLVITGGIPEFLPKFAKLKEEPGVNGVRQSRGGADSGLARVEAQDRGKTVLPLELGYLTRHATRCGGWRYCIKWSTPRTVANRVLWRLDDEGYNNFRRGLMMEGVIAPPDPEFIDMMIEQEQRNIDRLATVQHIPEMAKKMAILREKVGAMETAIRPPAPPPKRRTKK